MTTPDWELTGDTVTRLREELATVDEDTRADFEDFAAFIIDELAEFRVDPRVDELAAYHGLAFMSLVVNLTRNNHENGAIDHDTAGAITAMARGVAMVLARHAPD
ncbi:MAG: hypothetical protein ACXIVQ_11790 [Acidimicrobiales bacterium]